MFTKLAPCRNFGRPNTWTAQIPATQTNDNQPDGREANKFRRRQETVTCRWQISPDTGRPERCWEVLSSDATAPAGLAGAPVSFGTELRIDGQAA